MASVFVLVFFTQYEFVVGKSSTDRSLSKILAELLKGKSLDKLRNMMVYPTTTPSIPPGCEYNGQFYPPDSEIERGEDLESNWCFGAYCDGDGHVLQWDNFNCFPTPPTTTPPTTLPPGCYWQGKHYPPGDISQEENKGRNWCGGYICAEDGHVMAWDNFNCFPTTPTPPTTPPEPTTPAARRRKRQLS